ncbi:hypothetical protein HMPREF1552_01526 [Leptotrichia sp. oral taxon 879 str. F0557]|nr:hypothetical protein HMPREF1552_01526 [Leptotrichia sp. oral taxon 879 str. F0557]
MLRIQEAVKGFFFVKNFLTFCLLYGKLKNEVRKFGNLRKICI